jgi:hypothetical protein
MFEYLSRMLTNSQIYNAFDVCRQHVAPCPREEFE